MNARQRSKARRSHKMRREQDRVALREQKARIVAELREQGLTHDPRFLVSRSSVSYTFTPPRPIEEGVAGFVFVNGGLGVNEARARRVARK